MPEMPGMSLEKVIYTIGHSNRSLEDFVGLLKEHGIQAVVDVRSRPYSHFRHFHKPTLEMALPECLIGYYWFGPELGGQRRNETYQEHMETGLFARGIRRVEQCASNLRTVIMCAEARPDACHRQHITAALEQRGWTVLHIVGPGEVWTQASGPQRELDL